MFRGVEVKSVWREEGGEEGRGGLVEALVPADVLDSKDHGQLLKGHTGISAAGGLEGERRVKGVLGIAQVRGDEGQVPTFLPP